MAKAPGGGDDGEDGGNGKDLMSASELKPLLVQSKRKPVSCAIGMTKDKQGVLLLDRRMKPRKLMAAMKAKAKSAGLELDQVSVRFGRVSVDPGDSATAVFTVNKEAPAALRMKLQAKLRPAGFRKCDITVDAKLEDEGEEDEPEGEGADASNGSGGPATAGAPMATGGATTGATGAGRGGETGAGSIEAGDDAGGSTQRDGPGMQAGQGRRSQAPAGQDTAPPTAADPASNDADQSAPNAAQGASKPDKATVARRLAELVKRLVAALPSRPANADAMRKAATEGQAAVKSGDLAAAGKAADTLEQLLGNPASDGDAGATAVARGAGQQDTGAENIGAGTTQSGSAAPGAATNGVELPGSGQGGRAAAEVADKRGTAAATAPNGPLFGKASALWDGVRGKLERDIEAVMKAVAAEPAVEKEWVQEIHSHVEPVIKGLDDSLAKKLAEIAKATGGGHGKLVQEAQEIMSRYRAFVDENPMIAHLDANPLKKIAIRTTVDQALASLSRVLATAQPRSASKQG